MFGNYASFSVPVSPSENQGPQGTKIRENPGITAVTPAFLWVCACTGPTEHVSLTSVEQVSIPRRKIHPMEQATSRTLEVQGCLDRLREGDAAARAELLSLTWDRLHRLARKLLKDFPAVRRWEETDDVFQRAAIRLERALAADPPSSASHFFKLAALQIRRELLDLSRHFYGPEGMGRHHHTDGHPDGDRDPGHRLADPAAATDGPATLAQWTELHQAVERLPTQEREVFDLHYYTGLLLKDAAELLQISERTAKRRWRSARLLLHEALKGRDER